LKLDPVDLLVFSPHPDDEVIGTGGVIQQALAAGRTVRIVFSTNGDGYPRAAAALLGKRVSDLSPEDMRSLGRERSEEALRAASLLGLSASHLVFLGFRDSALAQAMQQALPEFIDVVRQARAAVAYVSDGRDDHSDHRATYRLVTAAIREVEPAPPLFTYMVHSGGNNDWPPPGPLYEKGTLDPRVPWPPPIRIPLTPGQSAAKLRALQAHASQWVLDHAYLGRFAKSEEVFWGP
jgi:LmbE family N-acetylglucosaminyl deacetylase